MYAHGSARVSPPLSKEEEDQLRRSNKKPKRVELSQGTVVAETPLEEERDPEEMSQQKPRLTYKDICMRVNGGKHIEADSEEEEAWSVNEDFTDEEDEGEKPTKEKSFNPLRPVVKMSREEIREVRQPGVHSVIVKLLGRRLNMKFLHQHLLKMWNPAGEMDFIDLENDYYLVRFAEKSDATRILLGGPWMIMDHYLIVQRWKLEFLPYEDKFKRVAVWIRIPRLPIEYYDRKVLWRIGNSLGYTIKVD